MIQKLPYISFLVVSLLAAMFIQAGFAQYESETYFIASAIDTTTGRYLEIPVIIHVEETFSGELVREYNLQIFSSPQEVHLPWYPPNYQEGTVMKMTAGTNGYDQDTFTYVVPGEKPENNLLFEHTFKLNPLQNEEETVSSSKTNIVVFDGVEYEVLIATTSDSTSMDFDVGKKLLLLEISEPSDKGTLNITLQKFLLGGPYSVHVDDVYIIDIVETSNTTHSTISFDYGPGDHTIEIYGTTAIPELPQAYLVATVGIIVAIIASLVFARNRLHPAALK